MGDRDQLVSFGSLSAWTRAARLVAGAVRRRRLSVVLFTLAFVALGATAGKLMPRTYESQARLLVKKNYVMPALANPKRSVPGGSEAAAQSAESAVMSRGSLELIVSSNELVTRWDRDRPAILRVKDRIVGLIAGPMHDEDKRDVLVEVLAKRISVNVNEDVVTVKATWTDPQTSLDLVNSAVNAFLESRRRLDVQTIADTYDLLKRSADKERALVDEQLSLVEDRQRTSVAQRLARPRRPAASPAAAAGPVDDGLGELRGNIRTAQAAVAAAEKRYRDRVNDVETRLAERRSVLTARHPDVVALEQQAARLRQEPDELVAARAREARLLAEYTARGGTGQPGADPAAPLPAAAPRPAASESDPPALPKDLEDDATVYARTLFKGSLETYQDLLARLKDTQLELQTAEAAFRYRYTVTLPARLPKKPTAPNVPLMVIGAMLAGLVGGLVRAVFAELKSRSLLSRTALTVYLSAPEPLADLS